MKRKILSAILVLALCVGLAVPALAEVSLEKGTDVRSIVSGAENTVYAIGDNGKVYKWSREPGANTFINPTQIFAEVKNPVQLAYSAAPGLYVLDAEGNVYGGSGTAKTDASDIAQIAANNNLVALLKSDGTVWVRDSSDNLRFNKYEGLSDIVYIETNFVEVKDSVIATGADNKHYKLTGQGSDLSVAEISASSTADKITTQFFEKIPSQNAFLSELKDFVIYDTKACAWVSYVPVDLFDESGQLFELLLSSYVVFDNDLDDVSPWAEESVADAIAAGLVPEQLRFGYTTPATRAEFCALAVTLYELATGNEITGRQSFDDTSDTNVEKAASVGIVNGVGNNKFDPLASLTREQAATMLSRLAAALDKPLPAQASTFADNASISSWAIDAVGQDRKSIV